MKIKNMKIEDFTEGQAELLKALSQGCNIAMYRGGQCRLRDKNHNPIKNLRMDMFEKVKDFIIQKDGLFYFDESKRETIPKQILR